MADIHDLDPQLANFRAYWLGWGAEARRDDTVTWTRSGVAHPRMNAVLRVAGADPATVLAEAGTTLANVPWLWDVAPDSDPGIGAYLESQGAQDLGRMPVMALALADFVPSGPGDVTIETVESPAGIAEWVGVYAGPMRVAESERGRAAQVDATRPADGTLQRYLGRIDGVPVGTAELFVSDGVAGIYLVTTAPEWRRRGVATALVERTLLEAREHGFTVATLQATDAGFPVYERMGFTTVGHIRSFRF